MPWTTTGAREVTAAVEGRAAGPLAAVTVGEAPAAGELVAGSLGLVATAAPGVEVPAGGVGPWRTRGWKE